MTGIRIEAFAFKGIKVYSLGQIVLLILNIPNIKYSYQNESMVETADSKPALAYSLGAGISIDRINVGIRYLVSDPVYNESLSWVGGSYSASGNLPSDMVQLLI